MKRITPGELRFHLAILLVRYLDYAQAKELARLIYAEVVGPAVDQVNRDWEESNRAKEADDQH